MNFLLLALLTGIACAEPSLQRTSRRTVYFGSFEALTSSRAVIVTSRKQATAVQIEDEEPNIKGKLWPPWPFNLIGSKHRKIDAEHGYTTATGYLRWAYLRERGRAGARQIQQVASELWFHLPPASPPLLLLASMPRNKGVPAIFSNPFIRNLALASLGVGIMSWAHSELNQKRRLTLLPLPAHYRDIHRAFLPPFLPEQVPFLADIEPDQEEPLVEPNKAKEEESSVDSGFSPKLREHLASLYQATPKPATLKSTFQDWSRSRDARKRERERGHRATIYDELVALQALKSQAMKKLNKRQQQSLESQREDTMGYALVTGASRGIGRALAVELARWEIPLILVARDVDKLTSLASDIERCYGVKCIVLPADLAKADTAEKIHEATRGAGLRVDILVNNAGISSTGPLVDSDVTVIQKILQVNAVSVATLSRLYCRDMKEQRRGRLLMVSSIAGCLSGSPNAACYAATKSFEKVLAVSMAKELERFGVGVTCLMPGAVGDTAFRSSSQSDEALCWKIPFYPRSAQVVARQGVRAMLAGDVEVIPGWQNRIWLKVCSPILPQRLANLLVEAAWSPFILKFPSFRTGAPRDVKKDETTPTISSTETPWPGFSSRPPPRLLMLPDTPVDTEDELSSVVSPTTTGGDAVVGEEAIAEHTTPLDGVHEEHRTLPGNTSPFNARTG